MTEEEQLKLQIFDDLLEELRNLKRCDQAIDALQDTTSDDAMAAWDDFWGTLSDVFHVVEHYEWLLNGGDHGEHRKIIEALRTRMPTTASA